MRCGDRYPVGFETNRNESAHRGKQLGAEHVTGGGMNRGNEKPQETSANTTSHAAQEREKLYAASATKNLIAAA